MITNLLLSVVSAIIGVFDTFLPKLAIGTLPSVAATVTAKLGHFLKFLTPAVPVSVIVLWLEVWAVVLLAAAGYSVALWVWEKIPVVGAHG